jgi:hypothetical protein
MESETVTLDIDEYRLLVAMRYLNACEAICRGLKNACGTNDFFFLVSLRSFIEYSRRGIWFLVWATDEQVRQAEDLTFEKPGSPPVAAMDELIVKAMGKGNRSPLRTMVKGTNTTFIDCLHALTHGNPISVRFTGLGLEKIFDVNGLLAKAELDLDIFRVLVYRRKLGEKFEDIWKVLSPISDQPTTLRTNALIAADLLMKSGKI